MSKHDLQARPIYHHTRESIEAHLSIVFAAMAVSHWIETQTGWSIKKFVRTARRYRTVQIKAGRQTLTAADPLPDDLREALAKIRGVVCTNLIKVRNDHDLRLRGSGRRPRRTIDLRRRNLTFITVAALGDSCRAVTCEFVVCLVRICALAVARRVRAWPMCAR